MAQEKKTTEIKVFVETKKTKDGRQFVCYRCLTKDKKKKDLRFTKTVTNKPVQDSFIIVDKSKINYDSNREYPCFWVKEILEIKPIEKEASGNIEDFFDF